MESYLVDVNIYIYNDNNSSCISCKQCFITYKVHTFIYKFEYRYYFRPLVCCFVGQKKNCTGKTKGM